jgi:hypothetical protein
VSTSGTGARIAGAAAESEPRSPAAAPAGASTVHQGAMIVEVAQPADATDAALDDVPVPEPAEAPNLTPWAVVLVAMLLAFAGAARTRSRRPR